jgi:hypothetical protein
LPVNDETHRAERSDAPPSRAGASLVTVIGVATVIAVMLSLLGVGAGVLHSVLSYDQPDRCCSTTTTSPWPGSRSRWT